MVNFACFTDKYIRLMIKLRNLLSDSLVLMKGHWVQAIAVFFVFNLAWFNRACLGSEVAVGACDYDVDVFQVQG